MRNHKLESKDFISKLTSLFSIFLGYSLALFFLLALNACNSVKVVNWEEVWNENKPTIAAGWSEPTMLSVNADSNWGDSLWIDDGDDDDETNDILYFMWSEGDLWAWHKFQLGEVTMLPNIWYSPYPFVEKFEHDLYYMANPESGAGGPQKDADGDWWYMSNHLSYYQDENEKAPQDLYVNDSRIDSHTTEYETNPHYCVSTQELWYDLHDQSIQMLKFDKNTMTTIESANPAPAPINSQGSEDQNFHPWLNAECNVMYFVSVRAGNLTPGIYMSEKSDGQTWSEPTPIVYGEGISVGEVSLTQNGDGAGAKLYYEQIVTHKGDNGVIDFTKETFDDTNTTLFFYIEKLP